MWLTSRPVERRNIRRALLALRSRVLSDGAPFFRVIAESFEHRDFAVVDGESYKSVKNRAREYALDLASTRVGSTVFISERRELDGVQCLVGVTEVCFEGFCHD